jgi:hypothetical protein
LDLLHPRIDMAGEKTGIIGSEFPFFNFMIYLFSIVFGYAHWYGRLINLVVSSLGIWGFYSLILKGLNKTVAFNATLILLSSIWFAYARKIMPDTFSVSLVIIGLYFAARYLVSGGLFSLFLFLSCSTLGGLCKIPSLCMASLLILPVFLKHLSLKRILLIYSTALLGFLIISFWYFYWVPHLVSTHGYQLYFPRAFIEGLNEIYQLRIKTLERFYFSSLHSYIAFTCFLAGLVLVFIRKDLYLKIAVSVVTLSFLIFVIKAGSVFSNHNYYIIPYAPVMALVAGYFIAQIKIRYQWILLVLIAIEGIANQHHDFIIRESERYKLKLEEIADHHIPEDQLIVINGGNSPQAIYFTNRKGWSIDNETMIKKTRIEEFRLKGAAYLIVDKTSFREDLDYPKIHTGEYFDIYHLASHN